MTKLEALRTLADKVDAGDWPVDAWSHLRMAYPTQWNEIELNARKAYHGSLDAAKALHEAVLPGWVFGVCNSDPEEEDMSFAATFPKSDTARESFEVKAETPARAWLLCILKALIWKEEQ